MAADEHSHKQTRPRIGSLVVRCTKPTATSSSSSSSSSGWTSSDHTSSSPRSPAPISHSAAATTAVSADSLRRNLLLLNAFSFLLGLGFLSPIFVLYIRAALAATDGPVRDGDKGGGSGGGERAATLTSLVLAAQSLACFAIELPAGVIADICGRRVCLLACAGLRLVGLAVLAAVEANMETLSLGARLAGFVSAAACEGAAQAMGSGTDVALLHDSLAALGRLDEFPRRLSHRSVMWPCAAAIASLVGAALADSPSLGGVQACVAATTLATLLAIPTALSMTEVYPRVYDPVRIWRRKRKRADRRSAHAAAANSALSTEPSTGRGRLENRSGRSSGSDDSPCSSISAPMMSPVLLSASPEALQFPAAAGQSRCPSPFPSLALPPPSMSHFTSLLRSHLHQCYSSLRLSAPLRSLIVVSCALYSLAEPVHRLRGVFLAAHGVPPSAFGAVSAALFALSALGSLLSARVRAAALRWGGVSERGVVVWTSALPPLLQWCACSAPPGMGAALLLLPGALLWGVRLPLLAHLLHRHLASSSQRATVASVQSLANKFVLVGHCAADSERALRWFSFAAPAACRSDVAARAD